MNKLTLTKKRMLISVIVICIVALSGLTLWLNTRTVVQAAVISPHAGLVGWWSFNEGSGTVAGDSSGYGNNGTIYGATWVPGKYGTALNFNGVNNYVDCGNRPSLQLTTAGTIIAWVKLNSSGYYPIVQKHNDANGRNGYGFWINGNSLDGDLGNASAENYIIASGLNINDGNWHYVAYVWNSTLTLYLDGRMVGSPANRILTPTGSLYDLWIGHGANYPGYFNGSIDEVRVYNRALSSAEIQADFQQGPNFSVNLLANVPQGTTQVITTLSWQGTGSINVTIVSPSQTYTESTLPEYQKTTYSTSGGLTSMLNIKRVSVSVSALPSDQSWNILLTLSNVGAYQISVEVQK
jgi:hypothetical protein